MAQSALCAGFKRWQRHAHNGVVAILIWGVATLAWSAGLGRVTVFSGLGQPLRAEIELTGSGDELSNISAQLASPEVFDRAGVFYGSGLSDLRFAVERRGVGAVLKVSSTRPINDPFIDFLVEANWNGGKAVRQYTFLLDPVSSNRSSDVALQPSLPEAPAYPQPTPQYAQPQYTPPPVQPTYPQPQYAQPQYAQPAYPASPLPYPGSPPQPLGGSLATPGLTAPLPSAQPAVPTESRRRGRQSALSADIGHGQGGSSHEVKRGETLGKIAAEFAGGVALDQMLVSIYQQNPHAFIRGNVNLVRSGAYLSIPDASVASQVTRSEIRRVLRGNVASWGKYRQRLAANPRSRSEASASSSRRGRVSAAQVNDGSVPSSTDRVRVRREQGSKSSAAALEEAQLTQQKQQADAEARRQKDEEIKRKQAALEQAKLAAKTPPPPTNQPAAVQADKPVVVPTPVPPPPAANPRPKVEAKPPPPPEPDLFSDPLGYLTSLVSGFSLAALGEWLLPIGGGLLALIVAIAAYFFFKKRRDGKRMSNDDFPGEELSDFSAARGARGKSARYADENSAYSQSRMSQTSGAAPSQATGMLTDFSQSGLGTIDTNDVDPVAEAEVYMAYGRDAQAEEILVEAIQNDPNRTAIHVKLLEIYQKRRMNQQFETVAGELYAVTGGVGPDWEKACQMGRDIDPNNPLYHGTSVAPSAHPPQQPSHAAAVAPHSHSGLDFAPAAMPQAAAPKAPPPPPPPPQGNVSSSSTDPNMLVFELPEPPPAKEVSKPSSSQDHAKASAQSTPDFSFDLHSDSGHDEDTAKRTVVNPKHSIDFEEDRLTALPESRDLNLTESTVVGHRPSGFDMSSLSLDLDEPSIGGEAQHGAQWEEVNTKLDLAKAYAEMSDHEGAKELLQEVLHEGSSEQINEAKALLAKLK